MELLLPQNLISKKVEDILSAATRTISFDSNQFTPGTDLMIKLDSKLKYEDGLNIIKNFFQKILFTLHILIEGEGEHKIFQFIREDKIIKGNGSTYFIWVWILT